MSGADPAPDGSHGPHVLVDSVESPHLSDADRHHLTRVLRVRDGDPLTVGDGAGNWRPCRLAAEPEPVERVFHVAKPEPAVGVAFALIKGGRPELVVQKLTELGVDRIAPFVADRSVVQWDEAKAAKNGERFRRVAREAVMQCRRAWLPDIDEVVPFAAVVGEAGVCMADRGGGALTLATPLVMIGPEGGWSDAEAAADVPRVRLAEPILRAETAAIAAGVLLGAARATPR
ncbi:MAG: RsmE family RNA methyltransferase [Acidimicrobiales bacterium]